MNEVPPRPQPDFPEDRSEDTSVLAGLAAFIGCFISAGMLLLPLFKLISPTKQEWTITAFFMTSVALAVTWFLLAKILNKLNHK